jgi:SpoVK/Ycf46/Vps4 family AAA+-type ATPase
MLAVKEAIRMSLLRKERDLLSLRDHRADSTGNDRYSSPWNVNNSATGTESLQLHMNDLQAAIRSIRPSAIKSISVEIPKVLWSSIGGMDTVKRELRDAIELPITHGRYFTELNVEPPKGILLYGPPGCSKTLMARALATESDELLSGQGSRIVVVEAVPVARDHHESLSLVPQIDQTCWMMR